MSIKNASHYFLRGGGEMGELTRAKDWSDTTLGDPSNWPQSLRTTLGILLNSKFPMFLWWGDELTCFYNDAYRPSLGNEGKHPVILGMPAKEAWTEIWDIIKPLIDKVLNEGESIWFEDMLVPIYRNGRIEDVYWTFSYSPVPDDSGKVAGVLVTCTETTEKVITLRKLEESNARFINNIMQAPVAMCILRGENHIVEIANAPMLYIWEKQADQVMHKPIFEGLPEAKDQGLEELLQHVYTTGEKFTANERPINLLRNGKTETTYINFVYEALKETDGTISGIVVIAIEVTTQVAARSQVEESEQKVRALVENAPFPIAVYVGKEMRIDLANQSIIDIWGKGNDVIGKSFKELLPELNDQSVFEQIEKVLTTGESFHTKNTPLDLVINGKTQNFYFNYSFTPLYDVAGNIYAVMNTGVDVTDLNIVKKQIEESEQNIRSMVLQSPIGICVLDAETLVSETVNGSFIEIAGKRYDEIAGKHYWETFAEAKPYYESALKKVIEEGESYYANEVEIMLIRHGVEEIIYVTFVYAPLKNIDGVVKKVAVWVLDNTPQVVTRRKIEEADKRFRNTVKQAPVGITILRGPQYIVEMANDAYMQLVDRKEESFVGHPLFDVLPEAKESVQTLLDGVLNSGIPFHGNELPVPLNRYGKQETCYFDFLYHPLKEQDGKISGIIVTVTEVTEKVESRKKTEQNEERLNIVVEASELGIWELNLKTMTPQYSQKYLYVVGGYTSNEQLTHVQLLQHIHPDDMHIREKAFQNALTTGLLHYEARVIWNDKSIHWIEGKGKVFYDSENKPEKMLGTIRDITAEKKHQQELQESEQRFRNLIMQSPVAKVILKGKDHIIEMVNDALLKNIWRKTESEVIGKKIIDAFPELKEQKYDRLLDEVFSTGKKQTRIESYISLNGNDGVRNYYIDSEYAPVYSGNNKISGIKITAIDVTEKVEARKKIEESEKRFRSLAESLPQLVWETDEKGNSLFASGRWEEYTGIKPNGEPEWKAIMHADDFEANTKAWMHSLATGELYRSDVRLKSKDGNYRWHTVIGEPVFDKDNKIVKWVGAFTDIQTEKAFTQELERQVAERTRELADTNAELEKMNRELQSFAYISSHDLQEPLRKIQTFSTQIVANEAQHLSESGKDKFRRMQNAAQRMQTLIDDLLTYSRTNTHERKFEITNLNKIVEDVKDDLKEELQHKQAIIEAPALGEVNIIPFQFRQLLFNLVNNSLKFSNPNKTPVIKITSEFAKGAEFKIAALKKDSTYCHISISDNGIGFEQQYSEKIFEVFQRLHGRNEYNGTGIGLSIVKRIVENHNGVITAKGELNKGATFDIYLPAI